MTIESFKELAHEEKLKELKFSGELLGSYERNNENGGPKTPGDIFALYDFWVYLSDDEETIIHPAATRYLQLIPSSSQLSKMSAKPGKTAFHFP